MEQIVIQQKPVYATAFINGFAATISLWLFWIPFITFVARPIINAQIKQEVCSTLNSQAMDYITLWNNKISELLYELYETGKITREELSELRRVLLYSPQGVSPDIQAILDDTWSNWNQNIGLITSFFVLFLIVLFCCFFIILSMCSLYGVDPYDILYFNLTMTLVIAIVEGLFFSFVAMRYVPYDIKLIVSIIQKNILDLF
jgi:hypothetical protein